MIVDIVYLCGYALGEAEDDTPVRADSDGPESDSVSGELMQSEPWEIHVLDRRGCVEARQDVAELLKMLLEDAAWIIRLVQASKTPVPN